MNILRSSSGLVVLFLFLIAAAGGMWWWPRPVQLLRDYMGFGMPQSDQYNNPSAQYYKDLEQRYAEDTYGGATPEETLQLFIAALEAGNIDLASKYFVIEKQEEWKGNLEKVKSGNKLDVMVKDFNGKKYFYELADKRIAFDILDGQRNVIATAEIVKIPNGKWKISSL